MKQCVQREVSMLQKSLDELAHNHKKALKENSSLRRTVGEPGRQLAKLCEDNNSFRQTLQRMVEMVKAKDDGGDQSCEQWLLI